MSGQSAVLQVVILRDGLLVGTEVFVPGSYVLGSGPEADLQLDGPGVDASHAVLFFQNGKAAIQDSRSRGGLYVNGHRVSACEVRPVDEIACGPFSLKVRALSKSPASQASMSAQVQGLLGKSPGQRPTLAPPKAPVAGAATLPSVQRSPAGGPTMVSARRAAAMSAPKRTSQPELMARAQPHLRAVTPLPPPFLDVDVDQTECALPRARLPSARKPSKSAPRTRSTPQIPAAEGKGRPKIFFELYWGETRQEARCYGKISAKKPVVGGHDHASPMPLWGFTLPEAPFVLARSAQRDYQIFVPPGAVVETRRADGNFYPLAVSELKVGPHGPCVTLANGSAVRLSEGEMSLVAYVQPPLKRPFANPLAGTPWLALLMLAVFSGGAGAFLYYAPHEGEAADFQTRGLPPVAVRLIAPQPKKKEEARKKLEELAAKAPKAKEAAKLKASKPAPRPKERVVASAPLITESPALKALAKLQAAGPAMNDILASVDKRGNGPGSKSGKDYKLSGLIGKAPIASAGLGSFGLGGGGGGGIGTRGAELLRGKGGGGIGALGAGGIGKGTVGGTVSRANARSLGVQGSIDREAVAKTVNAHLQEVRACYERALLREPGLAGKVVLEWNISTAGKVVSAKTKTSTLSNASVEGCILQNLKGWTFPPAKGGVVIVSYPFLFNSVGY